MWRRVETLIIKIISFLMYLILNIWKESLILLGRRQQHHRPDGTIIKNIST